MAIVVNKPVICLFGPTASGKTELAFRLADTFPITLISVDSAQIYRYMNIGSAKPDSDTLMRYPHALIDILDPEENYSAAQFCQEAKIEIEKAHAMGKVPLLVGGTMLYFYTLFAGLTDLPSADSVTRQHLTERMEKEGCASLYAELAKCDPEIAQKVSSNDRQRIMRFLELLILTGKTPSELYADQQAAKPPWSTLALGLNLNRKILHQRIEARFHNMITTGFLAEVTNLKARPLLTAAHSSMRAVGYRQIWQYLDNEMSWQQAIELGIIATRQLAKRQITWMNNRLQEVLPFTLYDPLEKETASRVITQVENFFCQHHFSC